MVWLLIVLLLVFFAIIFFIFIDLHLGKKANLHKAFPLEKKNRESQVTFFPSGDTFFNHLIQDLKAANDHIHVLFYIFRQDFIGSKLLDILELKAKEGVTVRIMVDQFGCSISLRNKHRLKKAGVLFTTTPPIGFPYFFFKLNQRNHRKIVVCDGRVGYIGGYNIGDEYLGRNPHFGRWRDFHLRLVGDGVQDLQSSFLQDWHQKKKRIQINTNNQRYFPALHKGTQSITLFRTNGALLEEEFYQKIGQAKKSLIIATAYFIPGEKLIKAIIKAAKRGVDIKIIVPKKSDHLFVREAAFPYYQRLLMNGVRIYQYYRGFFHTKALLIDERVAYIGTANFDQRSMFINFEQHVFVYDQTIISEVNNILDYDISISSPLTIKEYEERSFLFKLKEKVGQLISDYL
ncbi:cardiolipin synthetase [Bacillus sp. TS-2]|nr:cardiolipin synthetase [Bacillus sp. TS-2]